jgi:hypothetical protein
MDRGSIIFVSILFQQLSTILHTVFSVFLNAISCWNIFVSQLEQELKDQ